MSRRVFVRNVVSISVITMIFFVAEQTVTADGKGGYQGEQGTRIFGTLDESLEGIEVPHVPNQKPGQSKCTPVVLPKPETHLLGPKRVVAPSDGGRCKSVSANSYTSLRIVGGQLHKFMGGADVTGSIVGTTLVTARPSIKLIITDARQHRNIYTDNVSPSVWEYDVWVDDGAQPRSPLCDGDNDQNTALVVPGNWNKEGSLLEQDTWFTFACVPTLLRPKKAKTFAFRAQPAGASRSPAPSSPSMSRPQQAMRPTFLVPRVTHFTAEERKYWGLPIDEVERPYRGGGAAAKCIDYGYAPWDGGVSALGQATVTGGTLQPLPDRNLSARRFHNLCTRVMTADYTGTGRSHTIQGTMIRIFDMTNVPVSQCKVTGSPICEYLPPRFVVTPGEAIRRRSALAPRQGVAALPVTTVTAGPPTKKEPTCSSLDAAIASRLGDTFAKTAAWRVADLRYEGAWVVDRCGKARALCLAKARWQTIDAQDSRLSEAHESMGQGTWTYCEGGTLVEFDFYDTVLISYSAINEKGLYRFSRDSDMTNSSRWLTTSHVQTTANGIELDPEFHCPGCKYRSFEGDVISPELASETRSGFSAEFGMTPLCSYRDGSGTFINDCNCSSTSSGQSMCEGYLFKKPPDLPEAEYGHTGADAFALKTWKREHGDHPEESCVAVNSCGTNYHEDGRPPLGYVLLPDYLLPVPRHHIVNQDRPPIQLHQ